MEKIRQAVAAVRTFFAEVGVELRKCVWPTRSELVDSTVVVMVSVVLLAVFVGLCDGILMLALRALAR